MYVFIRAWIWRVSVPSFLDFNPPWPVTTYGLNPPSPVTRNWHHKFSPHHGTPSFFFHSHARHHAPCHTISHIFFTPSHTNRTPIAHNLHTNHRPISFLSFSFTPVSHTISVFTFTPNTTHPHNLNSFQKFTPWPFFTFHNFSSHVFSSSSLFSSLKHGQSGTPHSHLSFFLMSSSLVFSSSHFSLFLFFAFFSIPPPWCRHHFLFFSFHRLKFILHSNIFMTILVTS